MSEVAVSLSKHDMTLRGLVIWGFCEFEVQLFPDHFTSVIAVEDGSKPPDCGDVGLMCDLLS